MAITLYAPDLDRRTPRQIREAICARVAEKHRVSLEALYGRDGPRTVANARFEAWACLHTYGMSTTRIGKIFGRDHSTVVHGLKRFRALAQQEAA